jgi:carbon-monoxide dehydrogenase small subunit
MSATSRIRFVLNGRPVTAEVKIHHNLVEILQQHGLFGARESCGEGVCGCCTVLVDDTPVAGCLYLAVLLDGKSVTTVEHLNADGALSIVQRAFIETGAFQCGFCTPGFVLMAHELLRHNPDPSDEEIGQSLSGNLCRCGAYPEITKAVKLAARWQKEADALTATAAEQTPRAQASRIAAAS